MKTKHQSTFERLAQALDAFNGHSPRLLQPVTAELLYDRLEDRRGHVTCDERAGYRAPENGRLVFPKDLPGTIWTITNDEYNKLICMCAVRTLQDVEQREGSPV